TRFSRDWSSDVCSSDLADLVIDNDVQRAARTVATRLGQVEGFHDDALTGKCRVTVNEHGQNLGTGVVATTVLASTGAAFDHGVDDFQVGGVEGQRQVDWAATSGNIAGETIVILHVTDGQTFGMLAFKFGKQIAGHLAHDVDQHVQAA